MLVCGHLELSDSSFPGREKPEISALALEILQVCICVLQASFFFVLVRFFGFVFAPAFGSAHGSSHFLCNVTPK